MTDITTNDVVIKHNKYSNLPLTLFPSSIDKLSSHPYMIDVGLDSVSRVEEFETYYSNNDLDSCKTLLNDGLNVYSFNASKFNLLRDSVIALERFSTNGAVDDEKQLMYFLHLSVNTKLGMNFNLDYRVSQDFIEELTKILNS